MTQGIIFYNKGTRCLNRLCVAVSSLRDHYAGNITLLYEGSIPADFEAFYQYYNVLFIQIPEAEGKALVRKSQLWRFTPYDSTIYLDSDVFVMADIKGLFEALTESEFVVHQFCNWQTDGRRVSKRIKQWECVTSPGQVQAAIVYGRAVNTGVFAFQKDAKILPAWEDLTKAGYEAGCTPIMVDELACQMLLPLYPHIMLNEEWGVSGTYGDISKAKIIHYHGRKHVQDSPACEVWKKRYRKLLSKHPFLIQDQGDRRLRSYIRTLTYDITIVTAVNPEYVSKLKANFPRWQKMRGIQEKPLIVFINRINANDPKLDFLRDHHDVTLVPWKFPAAGANVRERMLSAFVFGVAKHVHTDFWMKLDADCTPKVDEFIYPDYQSYDLVAHPWGYTKVKGDPCTRRHWLNRLDDWYRYRLKRNSSKKFPEITGRRHSHKRTCSFCAIERTSFTRELAEVAGDRLPVPSQDTCSWYLSDRAGFKLLRTNMKQFFSP